MATSKVLTVADVHRGELVALLGQYTLELIVQDDGEPITGSFWGDSEAGVVATTVYVRGDTPIHSLLHETCHLICMTQERRERLDRDAGGDDLEEASVCYLQIVLADCLSGVGRHRVMRDMDSWGYSFRLGSTEKWFLKDAEDAREFLINQRLLTRQGNPVYALRR
ncbi:MAG: hypothetical protein HKO12_07290 [Woeseiaceae bacterium]|nr:hypothetical protein [Woeseiaceae bacterium]